MKKILTLIFAIGMITISFAQLNAEANAMKNSDEINHFYKEIKFMAIEKWGNDHEMVVYTINNQCESMFEMYELMEDENYNELLMNKSLGEWKTEKGFDYEMVIYTYKNQLKAKNSY